MKTLLFALLATAAITPAMAQNWNYATGSNGTRQQAYRQQTTVRPVAAQPVTKEITATTAQYRLGNPLYHPVAGGVVVGMNASYDYTPKEEAILQDKETSWELNPEVELGLTNKFSIMASASYGQSKIKSDLWGEKGKKTHTYATGVGLRYLLASADGLDFNVSAGLYYYKDRVQYKKHHRTDDRNAGTDIALQVGKKIENITPYFAVGFVTDFWSKRGSSNGTNTYINPGVYIDLTDCLSLNVGYTSVIHTDATYSASFDVYPADNLMLSLGGYINHPETDNDTYGAIARVKVAF